MLIRDVTCRTISTDDGNLNCCFVSQRHTGTERGREGKRNSKRERERESAESPRGYVHTCINMCETYVSRVRHFDALMLLYRTVRK